VIQQETQYVPSGTPACFDVRIENDGNTARAYFVKAEEERGGGWTVRYTLDGVDVTDSLARGGIATTTLQPAAYQLLKVEMTPAQNLSAGIRKNVVIKVMLSASIPEVIDAVKATAFTGIGSPPVVTSIQPKTGQSGKVVEITDLHGSGFKEGALVKLAMVGQKDVYAEDVNVVSNEQIECTFDLRGVPAGDWDVVVRNPDGQSGYLAKGFTVRPAETVRDVALTQFTASPTTVQRRGRVTFSYQVKNQGNVQETEVKFRLLQGSQQIGNPKILPTLEPEKEVSGTITVLVPRRTNPGEYLITGEVIPVAGETNVDNNRQTVKVVVQ